MAVTAAARETRTVVPARWDSEVFVLRGDDRDDLRARALALVAFVESYPDTPLPDLAATLASELRPHGSRLGVVVASRAELLTKLRRAADRIADPRCRQIRDTAGVYFFDQPLFPKGKLALLFPGEGAQYPDMLADLCGVFPEVEETFAWCDRLAADAGRPSLRGVLHPPPEQRAAAEVELRKLGPSIFGVLVADLAIIRVLRNLNLPVAAVAGHSAGELAALLAAGAMQSEEVLGPKLPDIMDLMQRQEDEAGGAEIALLAVGTGKATVVEVARAVSAGTVVIAMDNCPHQCVAVGPVGPVAAVEEALLGRGLVCERLPFRRPYHTPLFEPWMGAFRDLFADVPFAPPHTPVYCCSTGAKFPDDPAAIRELAVNQWVRPVEFAPMIEAMYADGVRVFVEAGPRGNLSAFVDDVLRGRPLAAIPANLPRKSGPTQINHLVAQLAAHHVPVNLGHLYANRPTARVEWEVSRRTPPRVEARPQSVGEARDAGQTEREGGWPRHARPEGPAVGLTDPSPSHLLPDGRGSHGHDVVMHGYLASMEQFLDVQREVMEAFLTGHATAVDHSQLDALFPADVAFLDLVPRTDPADTAPRPESRTPPAYSLVGRIEHLEPGRSVVFRRVMDEREDRYADDHTLGGRGVSRADPAQNGLPVLPMTFSLEAMAEAAALLAPGKVVVALRNIRLYRWLPFDPDPTTLEVRATVASVDPETGVVEVKADVRDLGNSFLRDGANKPASEAVIVLADRYPEPPAPLPFRLTNEVSCKSSVDDLRRNMFHGPLFQMIRELGRTGKEGIEGALVVEPRDRWFRSTTEPVIVLDPVLIDAAMHILGAWHLEQPDWTGRILLPFEVRRVEFFGPTPPVGSRLVLRGHNEEESARHCRHGLEVFAPDGRLWLRMTGAGYWRFYLPFGHVNFFGPKDQYFLSRDWPDAVPPRAEGSAPRRCHFLDPPVDLKQPVLRAAGARVTMTPAELAEFGSWNGTDAELNDWFFGRMLAKDPVRAAWTDKHGESIFPADIETDTVGGRIVCRPRDEPRAEPLPRVSVAKACGAFAAFAAFAESVGVALVAVEKDEPEGEARARAARQAVADALSIAPDSLTVEPGTQPGLLLVGHAGRQLRVQTARQKNLVVATTLCEVE
jgi:malonyl CoA-acyl carrier protein transacylase